jgi:hypothetical protein
MPFKKSDVDKHKKGLSSAQKEKWVDIANGVLSECIKNGGSDKTCAPKAIRIANSKFMDENKENKMAKSSDKKKQIPKNAFAFLMPTNEQCEFSVNEDNEIDRFKMVGYSGEIIPNHFYWGNLAFDLNGFKFTKDKYPILWGHDAYSLETILGFSITPNITDEGLIFTENEVTFVDNDNVTKFKDYSKKGVPFQASIRGNPTKIEYIKEGVSTTVNGREFNGPGHIWRETELVECSVCLFGADSHTSSQVFTEAGKEIVELDSSVFISSSTENENQNQNQLEIIMDYRTFSKEHPEEAKKFEALILDDAEKKFKKEAEELVSKHEAEVKEFSEKIADLETKVKQFEKEKAIAEEKARKEFADKIWEEKLAEASIPTRLHEKIKAFVSAEEFIKEDVLDEEAFALAVDKEIESWTDVSEEEPIQGSGSFQKKAVKHNEFDAKEAESVADALLSHVRV